MLRNLAAAGGIRQVAGLLRASWEHPANRGRRAPAIAKMIGWQIYKRVVRRPVTIDFHGRRLKCWPDSTSTNAALYFSGMPDYWEMSFLKAYLRAGDSFIDVGANAGVYSVLASACVGGEGWIDAFEPDEVSVRRVQEQAHLNGLRNMRVHQLAVSDREGELEFGFAQTSATLHLRRNCDPAAGGTKVRATTLDSFEPYASYAAGKMDIEGAEPFALAGALARLRTVNPPVWLLELAGYSTLYGVSSDAVVSQLHEAGFDCAIYDPTKARLDYTQTPWQQGVQNVLAISRARRSEVEGRLSEVAAKTAMNP